MTLGLLHRPRRFRIVSLLALPAAVFAVSAIPAEATPPAGYKLTWSDEFNQGVGHGPSMDNWKFEHGNNGGYGNGELEDYTDDLVHASIVADPQATDGQALQIQATDDNGGVGLAGKYRSARMNSSGHHSVKYGFLEARIKVPSTQGLWPAFWLLGDNIGTVGWPTCGEVDIMETVGLPSWMGTNASSLHSNAPGSTHDTHDTTSHYVAPKGVFFKDGYHLFQALWMPDSISFYVDGTLFETQTRASYGTNPWPFNASMFIILNCAVGGGFPGKPDATSVFPQKMLVDYIRVYDGKLSAPKTPKQIKAAAGNGKQIEVSWAGNDTNVTAYNVYRGTAAGKEDPTPYKTNVSATTFVETGVTPGITYYYKVAAVNPAGTSHELTEASAAAVKVADAPYNGAPAAIPGVIHFSDFDKGGSDVAYHTLSDSNQGGAYRPDEGVGIEACQDTGGGYSIGWASAGQWINYTVDVKTAGDYTVDVRAASDTAGGKFHLEDQHGNHLSGPISVEKTGGWQVWSTVSATATLAAGKQVITVVEDSDGYNLNTMTFTKK